MPTAKYVMFIAILVLIYHRWTLRSSWYRKFSSRFIADFAVMGILAITMAAVSLLFYVEQALIP